MISGVFFRMASTAGFEPATARLEGVCSIQLSYVDILAPNNNTKLSFRFQQLFCFFCKTHERILKQNLFHHADMQTDFLCEIVKRYIIHISMSEIIIHIHHTRYRESLNSLSCFIVHLSIMHLLQKPYTS